MDETDGVGDGEGAGEDRDIGLRGVEHRADVGLDRLGEEHFLRQEAVEQRYARHGGTGYHGKGGGHRHVTEQPAELSHVARAALVSMMPAAMNSDALKVAWFIMWKMAATAPSGLPRLSAWRSAEMADRRIGKKPLQVVLEDREEGSEQQ